MTSPWLRCSGVTKNGDPCGRMVPWYRTKCYQHRKQDLEYSRSQDRVLIYTDKNLSRPDGASSKLNYVIGQSSIWAMVIWAFVWIGLDNNLFCLTGIILLFYLGTRNWVEHRYVIVSGERKYLDELGEGDIENADKGNYEQAIEAIKPK